MLASRCNRVVRFGLWSTAVRIVASPTSANVMGTTSTAPDGLRVASRATRAAPTRASINRASAPWAGRAPARRTFAGAAPPEPHRRSARWRSLDRPASGSRGLRLLRQAEHPLADDVALDLRGTAPDRLRAGEEERCLQDRHGVVGAPAPAAVPGHELVLVARLAEQDLRVRTEHVHRQVHRVPVRLRPEHLVGGAQRRDPEVLLALHGRAQRAVAVEAHDLDLRPLLHEPLADRRILEGAVLARLVDDDLELLLEAAVARRGRRTALEAERRHRHLPPVVEPADDVLLGATGVREEHLVELRRAVGLHDGTDLDAVLLHRHEQVADAGVLRRVRVRARQEEDVVGVLRLRRPDLLPVDDPLVTVELGARLERREIGTGVGLAEPLAPRDLAREDLGQELLLLLLAPPLQDRGADERVAEEVGAQWRTGACELLVQHDVLHDRQALA